MTVRHKAMMISVFGALTFVSAGCDHSPRRVAIQGNVSYKGVPIAEGHIDFVPRDSAKGTTEGSNIVDGKYKFEPGKGLFPGAYNVSISMGQPQGANPTPGKAPGAPRRAGKELLPEEYNTQTKLSIDVPPSGQTDFAFDLK